jgi:hypothetical protein
VDLHLDDLSATFHQNDSSAVVCGECVRVLALFALARQRGEGWLDASEAWALWTELGGSPATSLARMSWERGKLRSQLSRQRVTRLDVLFESRKMGAFVRTRLGLDPATVSFRS